MTVGELRKFGLTLGAAFAVLGGISWWRGHHTVPLVLWALGGALGLAGLLIPAYLGPIQRAWMGFAHALSKVTTPIFMGIVYYLVVTPIALIMRPFGRSPLAHSESEAGFWVARTTEDAARSDMKRQF